MQEIGIPWWLSGKESACQAGDMGSIPGLGRSTGPGATEPSAATTEAALCNQRSHHNDKPVHRNQRVAPACLNWRKAHATTKTPINTYLYIHYINT